MISYDEIAKVAYELYEKSGRIEGRDLDNWLEAEKIVMARYATETVEQKTATKGRAKKTETKAGTKKQRVK